MSTLELVLRFGSIYCAGIAAGGWLLVLVALIPTKQRLEDRAALQVHQETTERIDRYMPPCTMVAIATGIALLLLPGRGAALAGVLTGIGVLGMSGAAAVSLGWNMPTNRRIAKWSADAVPPEYRTVQGAWDRTHLIRTLCGLAGLAGYTLALLMR